MRPRTKSVVNVHEYFSQDDGESDQEEDEDDHWMHVAMRGSSSSNNSSKSLKRPASFSKSKKAAANGAKRERTSTLESWEGTDIEDDDEEYDFDDDEDDEESTMHRKRNERLRTCSHDRRISFDTDVNVVTIPARSSFDAEYKRRVWYSHEEYSLMRQLD